MSEPTRIPEGVTPEPFSDFFADTLRHTDGSQTDRDASVTEAALILGITERSVWRRIRSKKLVATNRGGKTFVKICQSDIPPRQPDTTLSVTDVTQNVSDSSIADDQPNTANAFTLIAELSSKLEAATFRNGYLEAQLAERDQQLKLLTNNTTKTKGWRYFWQWFTKTGA